MFFLLDYYAKRDNNTSLVNIDIELFTPFLSKENLVKKLLDLTFEEILMLSKLQNFAKRENILNSNSDQNIFYNTQIFNYDVHLNFAKNLKYKSEVFSRQNSSYYFKFNFSDFIISNEDLDELIEKTEIFLGNFFDINAKFCPGYFESLFMVKKELDDLNINF